MKKITAIRHKKIELPNSMKPDKVRNPARMHIMKASDWPSYSRTPGTGAAKRDKENSRYESMKKHLEAVFIALTKADTETQIEVMRQRRILETQKKEIERMKEELEDLQAEVERLKRGRVLELER